MATQKRTFGVMARTHIDFYLVDPDGARKPPRHSALLLRLQYRYEIDRAGADIWELDWMDVFMAYLRCRIDLDGMKAGDEGFDAAEQSLATLKRLVPSPDHCFRYKLSMYLGFRNNKQCVDGMWDCKICYDETGYKTVCLCAPLLCPYTGRTSMVYYPDSAMTGEDHCAFWRRIADRELGSYSYSLPARKPQTPRSGFFGTFWRRCLGALCRVS